MRPALQNRAVVVAQATRLHDSVLAFTITVCITTAAQAQIYPVKPIRIITSGVGGAGDVASRLIAQGIAPALGQQVIVDNRASGPIPVEVTLKSPADGYTLMLYGSTVWLGPDLRTNAPDPLREFAAISLVATAPNILVVHPALPVKNVKELIALARARPGDLVYGSSGVGTAGHLSGELFSSMAKLKLIHVPYKGGPPSMIDLIAGRLQLVFATAVVAVPQMQAGKVKALAVTIAKRSAFAPELPTMAEAGLPGFEANNWYGLVAPVKTPPDIVARLNREVVALLNAPEVKDALFKQGIEAAPGTPEEFGAYMKSEIAKWRKVVQSSGATPN